MSLLTGLPESWKEQAVRDTLQRYSWMPGIEKVAENLEQKLALSELLRPEGWTNEQWDYYGEEYLQRISHEEER